MRCVLGLIAALVTAPAPATAAITVKTGATVGGTLIVLPPPPPELTYQTVAGDPSADSATFRYATGTIDGSTIRYAIVNGAYRVVETPSTTTLSGATIDHITGTNLNRGLIRLQNASAVRISNVAGTFRAKPATSIAYLPEGLQVEGNATNISVDSATFTGFQLIMGPTDYWNGDGVNWDARGIGASLRNIVANDNTDAGLDIKAPNVVLDNIYAQGNKRGIRLWDGCQCGTINLGQPIKRGGTGSGAGMWLHSGATMAKYVIQKLVVRFSNNTYPVIILDNPVDLTIVDCDIRVPAGTEFIHQDGSGSRIALGASCHT